MLYLFSLSLNILVKSMQLQISAMLVEMTDEYTYVCFSGPCCLAQFNTPLLVQEKVYN